MILYEDNARDALLVYLNKPRKKLEPPIGKMTILKRFKKDNSGENIYIIDHDDNGIADDDIINSIERIKKFSQFKDVFLYKHRTIGEKYLVVFNEDFPSWLINSLREIDMKPSDFGFTDQKGKFHIEIREKERRDGLNKILVKLNKQNSPMFQTLKEIFVLINHKP